MSMFPEIECPYCNSDDLDREECHYCGAFAQYCNNCNKNLCDCQILEEEKKINEQSR